MTTPGASEPVAGARSFADHYVDGKWVSSTESSRIEVVSPATEQVIAYAPDGTVADVNRAVDAARRAFDVGEWPRRSVAERAEVVAAARDRYRARADEMAALVTAEMGCPVALSATQTNPPLSFLDYYLDLVADFPFEELRDSTLVLREPVGVVGVISAWNFPQAILMFKLAPALLAGCTVVVKPATETPLDALLLAEIFDEAGLPPGVLNVVPAGREVGEHLVTHREVDKVAFTGSSATGRRIAMLCGSAMRRATFELGGKSAAILLDDADLSAVIPTLPGTALRNAGQACTNQSRILAPRSRYVEVVDAVCDLVASLRVGDPRDEDTEIGPLVSAVQRDRVESYLQIGRDEGARVAIGGGRPAGLSVGWYVEPTVFADVHNGMRIAQEEIFGPVLAVIPYDDDDDAVAIANDTQYGLSGAVWTRDRDRGLAIARRLRTGRVSLNGALPSVAAPFGGFKMSGLGREAGPEGLLSYVECKSIPLPA